MEINNDIHYPWEYTSREASGTVNAIYHGYEFDKVTYTDWADQEVTIDKIPINYVTPGPNSPHRSNRSVFMYPVEYMVYGQAASPLVKYKFNGSTEQWEKEFQILDLSGNELMQYKPGTIHIKPVTVEHLSYGEKRWISNERSDWSAWLSNHDDVESRLSDFNARLYDPDIGMFLAVDELWAEQPGWNPYHYAMNNPIMYEDRSGYRPRPQMSEEANDEYHRNMSEARKIGTQQGDEPLGIVTIGGGLSGGFIWGLTIEAGFIFNLDDFTQSGLYAEGSLDVGLFVEGDAYVSVGYIDPKGNNPLPTSALDGTFSSSSFGLLFVDGEYGENELYDFYSISGSTPINVGYKGRGIITGTWTPFYLED